MREQQGDGEDQRPIAVKALPAHVTDGRDLGRDQHRSAPLGSHDEGARAIPAIAALQLRSGVVPRDERSEDEDPVAR